MKYQELLDLSIDTLCFFCKTKLTEDDYVYPVPLSYNGGKIIKDVNTKDGSIQKYKSTLLMSDIMNIKEENDSSTTVISKVTYVCDNKIGHIDCCISNIKKNSVSFRLLKSLEDDLVNCRSVDIEISK